MERIVKMLYMEIPVFQCGEGYDTEAEEKRLLSQRCPNSTMNSVIATKMQPLSPPVNKICFDFRSVRRRMKTKPNLPHVLADRTSEKRPSHLNVSLYPSLLSSACKHLKFGAVELGRLTRPHGGSE